MPARFRLIAALLALAALLPTTLGCGGSASGGDFSTPEACFASMQTAGKNKNIAGMINCLTVESQEVLCGGMVLMGNMMKMFGGMAATGGDQGAEMKQQAEAIAAVLEKHGVTEDALKDAAPTAEMASDAGAIRKLAGVVSDKPQFIADMFAVMEKSSQGGNFSEEFESQIAGTLKDVKVEGDSATGTIVTTKGEEPIAFRKTAEGWKLHIELPAMGGGMPGPPA
jgi:hypothetical protein